MSRGAAVCAMSRAGCCGERPENCGKLQLSVSSNRRSESNSSVGPCSNSCLSWCHENKSSGSFLWRPEWRDAGCATGVETGVGSTVDSRPRSLVRGEWQREGSVSNESSVAVAAALACVRVGVRARAGEGGEVREGAGACSASGGVS